MPPALPEETWVRHKIHLESRKSSTNVQLKVYPFVYQEGICKATWKREFKLPWREAGPPNHHDNKVDSDQ